MRKWIIFIMLVFVTSVANAQNVVGNVEEIKKGEDGAILIGTDYTIDGVLFGTRDYITYYPEQLKLLTDQQKIDLIEQDVEERIKQIILHKYVKAVKHPIIQVREQLYTTEALKVEDVKTTIKNITVSKTTTKVFVDTTADGNYNQEWEIKTDGTKTATDIAPIAITSK